MQVTGAQSLGSGIAVFALDVDGRRIIFAASSRAMCVLDRYPVPPDREVERDHCVRVANSYPA